MESEAIRQMGMFIASYVIILVIGFGLINFLSNGFFTIFIQVRASRGKKILVKITTLTDSYYRPGQIDEGKLIFKDRLKEQRLIIVPKDTVYRSIGVACIDIDDEKNTIIKRLGEEVSGFDAKKFDNLYTRALTRPLVKNKNDQIKVALLVIVLLCAVAFIGYQVYNMGIQLTDIQSTINAIQSTGVIQ